MVTAEFVVYGKNYWEIDHQIQEILDSLVGDLLDQQVDYSVICSPGVQAEGQAAPVTWRGDVHATIKGIPMTMEYNRSKR